MAQGLGTALFPDRLLPAGVVGEMLQLDEWIWRDDDLERWTRVQFPRALERRRREFAAGRLCAARVVEALSGESMRPVAIGRRPSGAPDWPDGIVGSIAHSRQLAAAVAARRSDFGGLGLDVEPVMAAERVQALGRRVSTSAELAAVHRGSALTPPEALTAVFAVKEALFKCLHPMVHRVFGFHDAEVESVDWPPPERRAGASGRVSVRLMRALSESMTAGRRLDGAVVLCQPMPDAPGGAVVALVALPPP